MIKKKEAKDPTSCFNRAGMREMLFVLMGRDKAAPATIRYWCRERVKMGKNTWDDIQIKTAMRDADQMEEDYKGKT